MKDQLGGEKLIDTVQNKHLNLSKQDTQDLKSSRVQQVDENQEIFSKIKNSGEFSIKQVNNINEAMQEEQKRKQSMSENRSPNSSSLSDDQHNQLNDHNKSDQYDACESSACSQSRDSKSNNPAANRQKSSSKYYMNQSESSESNSSSHNMQKLKSQIGNMNLSCSSEQYQDESSPQNINNTFTSSVQANSNSKRIIENNQLSFQKAAAANSTNSSNKFHFNKENYFHILVSQQKEGKDEQLDVQSTIDKYNHFTEHLNQESFRSDQILPSALQTLQNSKHSASSQDLLSIIFCQNSQQLPFSLNIPQSITKFWSKETAISTEKLDAFGGLEKSINEKFINSRKNSSSQNSSDNLTTIHNNEYSNYHTSISSSSSNTAVQNCPPNKKQNSNQPLSSFMKKQTPPSSSQQQNTTTPIQPLSISSQQNLLKSPTSQWRSDLSDQKQQNNNQQISQHNRNTQESFSVQQNHFGNNAHQTGSTALGNLGNNLNNNGPQMQMSQITNLIHQTSQQLQNNSQASQQQASSNSVTNSQTLQSSTLTGSNNNSKKNRICNCKKTKCLKLYCDCFAVGELCGPDCKCVECCNNDTTLHLRNQAIESILERNPFAFNVKPDEVKKVKKEQSSIGPQSSASKVVGCNCRKSNCLKKYCLCYQSGLKCSEVCKCTECKNLENGLNSSSHSLCSTQVQFQQGQSNGVSALQYSSGQNKSQVPQTMYNQHLTQMYNGEGMQTGNNSNSNTIKKILENLALSAQQSQQSQQFNGSVQKQYSEQEDEEDERELMQSHILQQVQNQHNNQAALNSYNNIFLNAISQFSLNLQDHNQLNAGQVISPSFQNQSTRKKLFLNDSGQTTPVSPGGLPLASQQTHFNVQNINNLFSLIKNISTEQYQ